MFTSLNESLGVMFRSSKIEYMGLEKVNGTDCYVILIKPDVKALIAYLESVMVPELGGSLTQIGVNLSEAIKSLNVKLWVAKQDFLIKKQEVTMTLTVMDTDLQIMATTLITDYNKPIAITLPPEAHQASQMQPLKAGF